MKYVFFIAAPLLLVALVAQNRSTSAASTEAEGAAPEDKAIATLAGGCFWCVEADFEKVAGVTKAISGYAGGEERNPTYPQVSSGSTGHVEAVQVMFDPRQISYAQILNVFWKHVDPTYDKGQFVDRGRQYRTAIFYHDESQRQIAEKSRQALASSAIFDQPIVTEIRPLKEFYGAEEYQQTPQGVLWGGRVPSGLLQESSHSLSLLPIQLRARPVPGRGLERQEGFSGY